jgi:benzoate-CoA ligase family protein
MASSGGAAPRDASVVFPRRFNMADYFLYDRLREGLGEKEAIRTTARSWSYQEVVEWSDRVGNTLRGLGVQPEQRVLIALPDVPEFAFTIFGTLRVGGVVAMVNPLLPPDDLAYYVEYTRCRVLVCDSTVANGLLGRMDAYPSLHLLVLGDEVPTHERCHAWDAVVKQAAAELEPWPTTKDDPAYWLFTSGSTGRPKAAMHRHEDFPWNCERYAKQVLKIDRDDVTLSVPRLYFGYSTGTNLFFPFSVGATTCLFPQKPTPGLLLDRIEGFRPTVLTSVPTSIRQVVDHPGAESRKLDSLRCVLSAGEALPPEIYDRWMELFGVEILDGIGSAESFHIYISNRPGQAVQGSLGHLVPGYQARIVDDNGQDVEPGEVGRLMVNGGSIATGYWQAHEKSLETFRGGWLVTADLFRQDETGRFWYSGRADDVLKVGGMFVSPLEIENALLRHEAVAEVAVVEYKDGGLDKPIAFVVPEAGVEKSRELAVQIALTAKKHLARYKFPRRVAFLDELPRNDRGKIARRQLRERAADAGFNQWFDTDTKTLRQEEVSA